MKPITALASLGLALLLTGGASPPPSPEVRPVRTIVATPSAEGEPVSLTGHIRARTEESLAFRIDGRMIARRVDVGRLSSQATLSPNSTRSRSRTLCAPRKPHLPRRRPPSTKPPTTWSASGRWWARAGPPGSSSMPRRRRSSARKPRSMPPRPSCTTPRTSSATRSCWRTPRAR